MTIVGIILIALTIVWAVLLIRGIDEGRRMSEQQQLREAVERLKVTLEVNIRPAMEGFTAAMVSFTEAMLRFQRAFAKAKD